MVQNGPSGGYSRYDSLQQARQFTEDFREKALSLYGHESYPGERVFCFAVQNNRITFAVNDGHQIPERVARKLINVDEIRRLGKAGVDSNGFFDDSDGLGSDGTFQEEYYTKTVNSNGRRESSSDWKPPVRRRTRSRPSNNYQEASPATSRTHGIEIQNADAIWDAYQQCLRNCQQGLCKVIAKAWIKAVEPKKQTAHPYTKLDKGAPDWWPKPWGEGKDFMVRHKEPDHLHKHERVVLLCHIMRLILEPVATQHPDVRKSGLDIKKLREISHESLSSFFSETGKQGTSNRAKEKFLNNLFSIAKQEERYKNGEIDGTTLVYCLKPDKANETLVSDNDDNDEDGGRDYGRLGVMASPVEDSSSISGITSSQAVLDDMPLRSNFTPPILPNGVPSHQPFPVDVDASVPGHAAVGGPSGRMSIDMTGVHHDDGRRPAAYNGYESPGSSAMYARQWSIGSSPQNGAPMYTYAQPQQSQHTASFDARHGSMDTSQPFMANSMNGPPRNAYGAGATPILRGVDFQHPGIHPAHPPDQSYHYMEH